ncbi:hypothetical protein H0H93_004102 [Arthromyces matolae]|nr:hypothetical protein H0H93_004102 [Arthromyces matolae]
MHDLPCYREMHQQQLETKPALGLKMCCPALQLPPEILEQIFLFCLGPHSQAALNPPSQDSAPLLLCQICRYWRNVALSSPALWSAFHPGSYPTPNNISMINLCLERSKNYPLSLTFPRASDPNRDHVLDLFWAHMHRWFEIVFDAEVELASKLLALRSEAVPLLERIVFCYQHRTSDFQPLFSVLASLASLREIVCPDANYFPKAMVYISWSNIRYFAIYALIRGDECFSLLTNSPRVEKLSLFRYTNSSSNLSLRPILTLPYLMKLYISTAKGDTGELLDRLILPSLQSLDMHPPRDNKTLARLGARSSCNLTHLGLFDETIPSHLIPPYDPTVYVKLPCVQTIRSLFIDQAVTEAFLRLLIWDPVCHRDNYLPFLVEISGLFCYSADGVLSDMIASRWCKRRTGNLPTRLTFAKLRCLRQSFMTVNGAWKLLPDLSLHDQDSRVLRDIAGQGLELDFSPGY